MFAACRCKIVVAHAKISVSSASAAFPGKAAFILSHGGCSALTPPLAAGLTGCSGGLQMLEIEGRRPELVPAERIKKAAQQSLTAPKVPDIITSEVSSPMQHVERNGANRNEIK